MSTAPDLLRHLGGAPVGMEVLQPPDTHWVYSSATAAPYQAIQKHADRTHLHSTHAIAHGLTTSGRNDAVFTTPETHTLAAALTWSNSNTHLVGMHSASPWSNNCKILQTGSTAQSPAVTISGSDNLIANLHFQMDGTSANQHILVSNTGSGNHYENCWFEGPTNATQADDTAVETVTVDGGGNYFKSCMLGTTACQSNGAAVLGFTGSAYRSTFQDCVFYQNIDGTSAVLIDVSAAYDISGAQFFKNCIFSGFYTNQADRANEMIRTDGISARTGALIFDANCFLIGYDAWSDESQESIYCAHPLTAAHDGVYGGIVDPIGGTLP